MCCSVQLIGVNELSAGGLLRSWAVVGGHTSSWLSTLLTQVAPAAATAELHMQVHQQAAAVGLEQGLGGASLALPVALADCVQLGRGF